MWNIYDKFLNEQVEHNTVKGRRILMNLDEISKMDVSDKVVSALYKSILDKAISIDFGEIEDSKGDITKLRHYKTLEKCIETLESIVVNNQTLADELNVVKESIKLVTAYKKEFCLSFIQNKSMGINLYDAIVMSILFCTNSCMMDCYILITAPPDMDIKDFEKSRSNDENNIPLKSLRTINESAKKGELREFFNSFIKKDNFIGALPAIGVGTGVAVGAIALGAAIVLIPVMRELIYFFYNLRMSVSEFFEAQAEFLEMNIAELKAGDRKDKNKIIKRQENRVKKLNSIANFFEVKFNDAAKKTNKELSQKIKPESVTSSLQHDFTIV